KKQLISTVRQAAKATLTGETKVPVATAASTSRAERPVLAPKPIAASVAPSTERRTNVPSNLPPPSLLRSPIAAGKVNEDELRQRAVLLEQKSGEFDVQGVVHQIHPGPV